MKKSLYKKLVRMARDGDAEAIEAVAEIVENLTEELPVVPAQGPETIVVGYPPEAPAEAPAEEAENSRDSDPETAILERLDRIIALLTPAAADEESDPVAEIAEAVAEAVEAGAAAEAPADADTREIAEIMKEVLEPSTVLEPEEEADACADPLAADAVRAALKAVRPAIARMPKEQRKQVCGEIARRLRRTAGDSRQGTAGAYAALARAGGKNRAADPAELGRRIMASRNINCRG